MLRDSVERLGLLGDAAALRSPISMVVPGNTSAMPSFLRVLPLARKAFTLAREAHSEQRRESDAAPFIVDPLEVAALLHNTGRSDRVMAATILHDTIERTAIDLETVRTEFGRQIAGWRRQSETLMPSHPLVRQLRFELEILHALPPRPICC